MHQRHSKKPRRAPCGLEHDMDPFFMGLAAAEFMPADPAAWFDAACAARMTFKQRAGIVVLSGSSRGDGTRDFLAGLLIGTIGGTAAVGAWMAARGITNILEGAGP